MVDIMNERLQRQVRIRILVRDYSRTHKFVYEIMRGVTSMEVDNCESVGEIKID